MFAARIALDLDLGRFRLLVADNGRQKDVDELAAPHSA